MAFRPLKQKSATTNSNVVYPVPKAGSRKARVSLIVDLGIQAREDFEDEETGEVRAQKPCQQVAVFADLVADKVDYGGDIGKQHYRLLLNKSFAGKVHGINFVEVPPKDAKGNIIKGKPWTLHPANILTTLAKATGETNVIESMDIEQLLGKAFMATVEVKETQSDKVDDEGKPIVYCNVNFKGASEVPTQEDDDGNETPIDVAELAQEPRAIQFSNATVEDIKFLRRNIISMIKLAKNYAGSQMQKAIEEFEAQEANGSEEAEEDKPAPKKAKTSPAPKTTKAKAGPEVEDSVEDEDQESPF